MVRQLLDVRRIESAKAVNCELLWDAQFHAAQSLHRPTDAFEMSFNQAVGVLQCDPGAHQCVDDLVARHRDRAAAEHAARGQNAVAAEFALEQCRWVDDSRRGGRAHQ